MPFGDLRWPDLVHDSVRADVAEWSRHHHLIVTRLALGTLGLASLPAYLAWRGVPSLSDAALALALAAPILAAAIASMTGRLALAWGVSAASSAGLAFYLAASSGHVWLALLWLLIEPLDALLAGGHRPAIVAAALSCCALALFGLMQVPVTGETVWPARLAIGFLGMSALIETAGLLLRQRQLEAVSRNAEQMRDLQDRSLVDAIGDLVAWHDRSGEVLKASPSAAHFLGVAASALTGGRLLQHVHVSDRPVYLKALSDAANGDEPCSAEFRLHRGPEAGRSGAAAWRAGEAHANPPEVVWVEMRAQKVTGRADQAGGMAVISVIRDASTHRRHAEELEQARLEAERASELKARFLATVTHELRTPLNAIIGFSELLSLEHPYVLTDDRRREYAHIIRNSGHHLLDVVNTLLDISKIETGNFNFDPETFSIGELADGCCDLMQIKADQADITLRREVARDLPEITADRRACRQILINLLSNAVKFTPAGGWVGVSIAREGERVVLAVSDTGIGIGAGDLPRLGDPFFQAGDAYRRPHEGTGLGLSVVRGLVGLHHGTLAIESGQGVGTTVTVSLPLACPETPVSAKPVTVRTLVRPPASLERLSA